jgi:hypothetical protein
LFNTIQLPIAKWQWFTEANAQILPQVGFRLISDRTPHRKAKILGIAVLIIACGVKINQLTNAEMLLDTRVALTL